MENYVVNASARDRIIINWWLSPEAVKKALKIHVKLEKYSDHTPLQLFPFGELYWDYEEGLKWQTDFDHLEECVEFIRAFHKKRKQPLIWTPEGSDEMSVISTSVNYLSDSEEDELFAKAGLERDGFGHGFPLPKKATQKVGKRGNKSTQEEIGKTVRKLVVKYLSGEQYSVSFIKEVSGVVKVDAELAMTRDSAGSLIWQEGKDALRNKPYPSDTKASIIRQVNELYKK